MTMDITMPEMDGIESVKEIRKINKTVKIIMVTSHGQEDMVMGAIKAGANGYVLKPVNTENLSAAIRKIYPELAPTQTKPSTPDTSKANDDDDDLKLDDSLL
jgi:two-component system chemotaxis response regulator CheY